MYGKKACESPTHTIAHYQCTSFKDCLLWTGNKSMLLACDYALQYPEMITEGLDKFIFKYSSIFYTTNQSHI